MLSPANPMSPGMSPRSKNQKRARRGSKEKMSKTQTFGGKQSPRVGTASDKVGRQKRMGKEASTASTTASSLPMDKTHSAPAHVGRKKRSQEEDDEEGGDSPNRLDSPEQSYSLGQDAVEESEAGQNSPAP